MSIIEDADRLVRYVSNLKTTGGKLINENPSATPSTSVGIFREGLPEWTPGETYKLGQLFQYNGSAGYVKQPSLTAQEIFPPFSPGTEALYGARPEPDADGILPYVYNMGAAPGDRVRGEDGNIYVRNSNPDQIWEMLYPPEQMPAQFDKEE